MNKPESFKKELQEPDPALLAGLQDLLRHDAAATGRSDAHQAWAWTRLQARLQEVQMRPRGWPALSRWFFPAAGLTLAGLAAVVFIWRDSTSLSRVQTLSPSLYASTFYSREAGADVIWVTGYNYERGDSTGATP